jgi:hypothetical protein
LDNGDKRIDMENIAPPAPPAPGPGDPKPASAQSQKALIESLSLVKSIAGAAAAFNNKCASGDTFENNCAHYLSDAFIRAGYAQLNPPSACVQARCSTPSKRPIRARDMWCWFQSMATKNQSTLPSNDGFWAVFQLKESEYWGGHVVIINTDTGEYYGTGNYPQWDQHCYKW